MASHRTGGIAHVGSHRRFGWRGTSLLVTSPRGECGDDDPVSGFYFRETRYLRTLRLEINGSRPWQCADGTASPHELTFVYIHPELTTLGGGGSGMAGDSVPKDAHGIPHRAVDIRLRYTLGLDGFDATLTLANRSSEPVELTLAWIVDADYADILEAHGGERRQHAHVQTHTGAGDLHYYYLHPALALATHIAAAGAGEWCAAEGRISCRLTLAPRQAAEATLRVTAEDHEARLDETDITERNERLERWRDRLTMTEVPGNLVFEQMLRQSAEDLGSLALLEGEQDEWLAIQAGLPLYPALFGRDAVTAGWQAALLDRGDLLDACLIRLGRLQGRAVVPERDEEPGRIVQQVRRGPLARLGLTPFGCYYADFASPLMYVISLAHLYAWVGDRACLERHWDVARRVLDWARDYGDRDGDGYLEYETAARDGPKNQGWKDSGDAITYEDGRPVPSPIATCELQGYWYAAQQLMAVLSWVIGDHEGAKALWRSAAELKERFNRHWWRADESFIALALDADKRQVRSIASNVGHCLAAGIISDEYIPPVVGRLFAPDMFSGWGIRTLSSAHPSYNPLSYHLGSVWPVENATIAFGLRRFGFDARALDLAGALFDLATLYERGRIPECVGGYGRAEFPHPGAYPRANSVQAWNQSAFPLLLHTILGLQPVAALDLLVVDPVLPPWLPEITLRGLRLGGATASIRFARGADGRSHAEVIHKRGTLHLVHQPPLESLHAGAADRLGALVQSVFHQ